MTCIAERLFLKLIWRFGLLESGAAKQEQRTVSQERRGLASSFILSRQCILIIIQGWLEALSALK